MKSFSTAMITLRLYTDYHCTISINQLQWIQQCR